MKQGVKYGWNPVSRYITIETGVRPKPEHQLEDSSMHKYIHTLLLCYEHDWHQLKFIKKRESPLFSIMHIMMIGHRGFKLLILYN